MSQRGRLVSLSANLQITQNYVSATERPVTGEEAIPVELSHEELLYCS